MNINNNRLMNIIEEIVIDRKFTHLIRKCIKAGYSNYKINTPFNSLLYPIFINIYLDSFDKYIEQLKEKFDIENYNPNFQYQSLFYIRYMSNWLIGLKGTYIDCNNILDNINTFITNINLDFNKGKYEIININLDKVFFLGTYIYKYKNKKHITNVYSNYLIKGRYDNKLKLEAPIRMIIDK
jgi:hypothetical protein